VHFRVSADEVCIRLLSQSLSRAKVLVALSKTSNSQCDALVQELVSGLQHLSEGTRALQTQVRKNHGAKLADIQKALHSETTSADTTDAEVAKVIPQAALQRHAARPIAAVRVTEAGVPLEE